MMQGTLTGSSRPLFPDRSNIIILAVVVVVWAVVRLLLLLHLLLHLRQSSALTQSLRVPLILLDGRAMYALWLTINTVTNAQYATLQTQMHRYYGKKLAVVVVVVAEAEVEMVMCSK
jgi:hypothetical protein